MPATNPALIAGCLTDYLIDADAIAGADGSTVATLGEYGSAGVGSPTLKYNALNGLKSLLFTGGEKGLLATPPLWTPNPNSTGGCYPVGFSAIAVVKLANLTPVGVGYPGDRRSFVSWRSSPNTDSDSTWAIHASRKQVCSFQHHDTSGSWGHSTDAPDTVQLFTAELNAWALYGIRSTGAEMTLWKGLSVDKTTFNSFAPAFTQYISGLCVGTDISRPGDRFLDGEIAYFVPFSVALTDQLFEDAATWLLQRFGMPLREIAVAGRVGTTGKDLFLSFASSASGIQSYTKSFTGPTAGGVTYRVNGGAPVTPTEVIWCPNTLKESSYLSVTLDTPVTNTDTLTFSLAHNAINTSLGLVAALTDEPATNHAGDFSMLPLAPPGPVTMPLGWNVYTAQYWATTSLYKNLFKAGTMANASGVTLDARGYAVAPPSLFRYLIRPGVADPATMVGDYPGGKFGRYLLKYTCVTAGLLAVVLDLGDGGETVITHVPELDDLAGTVKRRYYDVLPSGTGTKYRPSLALIHENDGHTCTDIEVMLAEYEGTPGTLDPDVLARWNGFGSVRLLDPMLINFSNVSKFSEFPDRDDAFWYKTKIRSVPITKIESWDGPYYNPRANNQDLKITFGAPHGLGLNQDFRFRRAGGLNITFADSEVFDLTAQGGVVCEAYSLSATEAHVTFPGYMTGKAHRSLLAPWEDTGAFADVEITTGIGPEVAAELANEANVGALWFLHPAKMDDAGVAATVEVLAATLLPGIKLYSELSNEFWNSSFAQYKFFRNEAARRGLSPAGPGEPNAALGYAARACEVWDIVLATWVGAGRSAGDLEFIVGSQHAGASWTVGIAGWLAANRPELHIKLATAPYSEENELGRVEAPNWPSWTLDRVMDFHEARFLAFKTPRYVQDHINILNDNGISHEIYNYETNMGLLGLSRANDPGSSDPTVKFETWNRQSLAAFLHPRTCRIATLMMWNEQQAGIKHSCTYGYNNSPTYEPGLGNFGLILYGDVLGVDIPLGIGDGSDGHPDNRPLIVDGAGLPKYPTTWQLPSPRAEARRLWTAALSAPAVPPESGCLSELFWLAR